jgi:hypothetical protein
MGELLGILPATFSFHENALEIRSWAIEYPPVLTVLVLCVSLVSLVVFSSLHITRVRDQLAEAERALHLQSWHLRQLIPSQAQQVLAPRLDEATSTSLLQCPLPLGQSRNRSAKATSLS